MLMNVESRADDQVEDRIGGLVFGYTEESIEEKLEEQLEEDVAEEVSEQVEDQVEEKVAEQVTDEIEEQIEEKVRGLVFGYTEESVERKVEERVEESLEEVIEEAVNDTIASNIEDELEQNVEEEIEQDIEEEIEEDIEESVAQQVEENIEDSIESEVEEAVAASVEDAVEDEVTNSLEVAVEEELESGIEQVVAVNLEERVDESVAGTVEDRLENQIDDVIDAIENDLEIDEDRIHKGKWLVMAEPEVFAELAEEGYLFDSITKLPGLGMLLADVAAPSSFNITEARQGVIDVVGSGRADVDLNHIYAAGTLSEASSDGIQPRNAIEVPDDTDLMPLKIGMIDSRVDASHPSLSSSTIKARSFVPEDADVPQFHGTAVASIIAARDKDYLGLAPQADLYAAGVFEIDQQQGEIASTMSLIRALDWLVSSDVEVVNISLAGPPNRLLETALKRAAQRHILIVAAAGNGGPAAQPMYPAAYDSVMAVTAVDARGQVFRLANRGDYLDIAAPGVDLLHARAGGGYVASSGTSFAVPFAATAAARLRRLHPQGDAVELLYAAAQDLGPPGPDEIYGHGLLRLQASPSSM
jgi:subtilisin family serine protease